MRQTVANFIATDPRSGDIVPTRLATPPDLKQTLTDLTWIDTVRGSKIYFEGSSIT
jgi:hypothetical protein